MNVADHAYRVEMDEHLSRLLLAQLQSLGLFDSPSTSAADIEQWKVRTGLPRLYERWLSHSIEVLCKHAHLRAAERGRWTTEGAPKPVAVQWSDWREHSARWVQSADLAAEVRLVEAAMRALPEILTARVAATEVLFPQSSLSLVEGIYKGNPRADYFNEVLAQTLLAYLRARVEREPATRLRIIEIGAGTGGTSASLFEKLAAHGQHVEEYRYTDLSKAFLLRAEEVYGPRAPYLRCSRFDVEQAPEAQAISPCSYDVAIASNVLHATTNIRRTLRNVKATMKGRGLLLLNEMNCFTLVGHLTFGLLEGWWRYEDEPLRIPGTPALDATTWRRVLREEGFQSILFPVEAASPWGQQIVVAESDGLIRRSALEQEGRPPVPAPRESAPVSQASEALTDQMQKAQLVSLIRECIAQSLRLPEHEIQDLRSFSDYGVDSIVAVALTNRIGEKCGINLPATVVFDHNNVDRLAQHIYKSRPASPLPPKPLAATPIPRPGGAGKCPCTGAGTGSRDADPGCGRFGLVLSGRANPAPGKHR